MNYKILVECSVNRGSGWIAFEFPSTCNFVILGNYFFVIGGDERTSNTSKWMCIIQFKTCERDIAKNIVLEVAWGSSRGVKKDIRSDSKLSRRE